MDHLAIARKYRPHRFREVAGQDIVARTLGNALRSGRLAQAYLFTGPRGTGKTTMARILAMALACSGDPERLAAGDPAPTGPVTEPCGRCEHCRMIIDSRHPDVLEVDAARFNKVDDIRELADSLSFAPSQARLRVIILDEVHMLSTAAWNALLKVLEEPPAHVRYVFATTEVDKVLPTVLSRCQRFDFRPISIDVVADTLADIARQEGADLPEVVRLRIARVSGGGMRDAQQLLDQLLAVSEGTPREDDLDLLLGAARSGDVAQLMERLAAGDRGGALALLDGVLGAGVAASTLIEQLIDHSRAVLLFQAVGGETPGFRRIGIAVDTAQALAGMLPGEKVLRICQLLIGAQQALRQGVDARLQLELTCVRIAGLGRLVDLEALLKRIERAEAAAPPRP